MTVLMNNTINTIFRRAEDHLTRLRELQEVAKGDLLEITNDEGTTTTVDLMEIIRDVELLLLMSADAVLGLEQAVGPGTPEVNKMPGGIPPVAKGDDDEEKTGQYL